MTSARKRFIGKPDLELEAEHVLDTYERMCPGQGILPAPVEQILEHVFDGFIEFDDCRERFGKADILGATVFIGGETPSVVIDNSLNPDILPWMIGRYRFTLAHEIGHLALHRNEIQKEGDSLFRSTRKDRLEYQADFFAAALLMPRKILKICWEKLYGNVSHIENVYQELREAEALKPGCHPICQLARHLSETFGVSMEAMQNRLCDLNLISAEAPMPPSQQRT